MKSPKNIIGRLAERAELEAAFDSARSGKGGMVLLAGEAGMGKTRLAEECMAASGLTVFTGRTRQEATAPYAPISGVLRDCLRQSPELASQSNPLMSHLALLLPELGRVADEIDDDTLIEAIGSLLAAAARKNPSVIFVDDLQWADNATMELLPPLADRLSDERLVILGTYRSDEITRGHPIRRMRTELRRKRFLKEINVGPLGAGDARELIERVLGESVSDALVDLIYERAHGVPFYVEELCSTLSSGGYLHDGETGLELAAGKAIPIPESIRDVVLLRMDGLSDRARAQLEVASVVGMEFDLDLVAELAGEESGLEELLDRGFIIEVQPGRGAFRHELTREAVQSDIMWSRRRTLNRRIAGYLEKAGSTPELIAEHWLAANEHARARRSLLASAERSCRLHAYRDAARAANRALEIWPEGEDEATRIDALERLAHCAQVSGQLGDAVRALREVIACPETANNHRRRGEALRSLATVHGLQGSRERAMEASRQAAEAFRQAGMAGEAATEYLSAAGHLTALLHLSTAIDAVRTAGRLASESKRPDVEARAKGLEGNVLAMQGKSQEGREAAEAGLSLALDHNLTDVASEVYRRLGSVLEYSSDYTGSRDAYTSAVNYCQAQGADVQASACMGCMSWALFRMGDWKRGAELCRDVLKSEDANSGSKSTASGVLGLIRLHRGEVKQARSSFRSSQQVARRLGMVAVELINMGGLAMVCEHEGADDDARAHYEQMLDLWQRTQDRHDALLGLCAASSFFAARGNESEAARCTRALAAIASATGNSEALASLAFALGETAMMNANPEKACREFGQALAHFERMEVPLERSKTEWRLGVALRATGADEAAVRHLTNAYRVARRLGARPQASQIAETLAELGETIEEGRAADPTKRADQGGLTRRQIEVTRLIASGLTNKEIAHKLYLSPRTIDMHVANVLNRLDCRSRSEAVRKAGELGLLD